MRCPAHWFADQLIRPPLLNATGAAERSDHDSSIQELVEQARSQIRNLKVDERPPRTRSRHGHTHRHPRVRRGLTHRRDPRSDPGTTRHAGVLGRPGQTPFTARSSTPRRVPCSTAIGRALSAGRSEPANPRLHRRRAPGRRTEGLGGALPPRDPPTHRTERANDRRRATVVASVLLVSDAVMRQAARRAHHKPALPSGTTRTRTG
jgi:hypothetical protein